MLCIHCKVNISLLLKLCTAQHRRKLDNVKKDIMYQEKLFAEEESKHQQRVEQMKKSAAVILSQAKKYKFKMWHSNAKKRAIKGS